MQYILTPSQMRESDNAAIEELKIPSSILMENAARSAADIISERFFSEESVDPLPASVMVLCGPGNNGGDGFALARHLSHVAQVSVVSIGDADRMSPETRNNLEMLSGFPIKVLRAEEHAEIAEQLRYSNIIVDAILGIGGGSQLRSPIPELLRQVRDLTKKRHAHHVAIDVPTGLDALTGAASPDAFCADLTITMSAAKIGMYLDQGPAVCGKIAIAGIGTPPDHNAHRGAYCKLEASDVREFLPPRQRNSSKFDYGRVLLIGGSKNMPGAITLSANAAISAGAGLVTLCTTAVHASLLPEVMLRQVPADPMGYISLRAAEMLQAEIAKSDVVLIGPGLGREPQTLELVGMLLRTMPEAFTCILDADALAIWPAYSQPTTPDRISTPHIGEFARGLGITREEALSDLELNLGLWQQKVSRNVLLKGVPTRIISRQKRFLHTGGNPGMATAGSGDVLAGVIAALIGQGLSSQIAAAVGAWIHAQAGDLALELHAEQGLTASHIIENLGKVFANLRGT